jgi:hypothetical protein
MDKMKVLTKWLKKYQFWVLIVALLVVGFGVWWLATGALAKEHDSNESTINNKFSSMQQLAGRERHPNEVYLENMDETIRSRRRGTASEGPGKRSTKNRAPCSNGRMS